MSLEPAIFTKIPLGSKVATGLTDQPRTRFENWTDHLAMLEATFHPSCWNLIMTLTVSSIETNASKNFTTSVVHDKNLPGRGLGLKVHCYLLQMKSPTFFAVLMPLTSIG